MKKQQWTCGHFHSIKVPVSKSAPWNKSKASIGCEVEQSLRPDWKAQVRRTVPWHALQALQYEMPKVYAPQPDRKKYTLSSRIASNWRETLDICCFKCKITTSSETGGFCKQEAQRSEFILKASRWRCADQRSAGRLRGFESDCATAAENELRTSGCLRVWKMPHPCRSRKEPRRWNSSPCSSADKRRQKL